MGVGLFAGCGSSSDTEPPSTRSASGGAGLIRECPGSGSEKPSVVNLENRLDLRVSLWFSQVDCYDWSGRSPTSRTPVYYSPINLPAGSTSPGGIASTSMAVDPSNRGGPPSSKRRPWLTTVQTANGTVVARFRLAFARFRDAVNDKEWTAMAMWNGSAYSLDASAVLPADLVGGKPAKAVIGKENTLVLRYDK